MSKILLHNIWHQDGTYDIQIENNRFVAITKTKALSEWNLSDDIQVVDASGKAILPAFYNGHTHAAMSLLRAYADDMPLATWLNEHIWPAEAKMTTEDMYHGVKLSILEMIKSGTVFFNDMYFAWERCAEAVEEMGLRAVVADSFIDRGDEAYANQFLARFKSQQALNTDKIRFAIAPHAMYTVGGDMLRRCAEAAREADQFLHIHLAETQQEMDDSLAKYGMTPTEYLHSLGVLGPKTIVAHAIYLTDNDMDILKETQTVLVHNPCSNMKLASGIFPSKAVSDKALRVILGTDGSSSNNNLDMREEMKFAALMAKLRYGAEALPATQVLQWATADAAAAFGIDAGVIAEGKLADAVIVNLKHERMTPSFNLTSNWVYSADSSVIDSVLCDGRFLMQNGRVPNEDNIRENAERCAFDLLKRVK